MTPFFTVPAQSIDAGGIGRAFDLPEAWRAHAFEDTDVKVTAGQAEVRLSRSGNDVVLRGKVTAEVALECARCLKPLRESVVGDLSLLLRPAPGANDGGHGHGHGHDKLHAGRRKDDEDDGYEFSPDEADADTYDGETVVLDDFLREAILLEVPTFPLCSEDCPGMGPLPQTSLNDERPAVDPRLSPLQALREKLASRGAPAETTGAGGAPEPPKRAPGPRPKIQTHRATGAIGKLSASNRAKTKPSKKAK